MERNPHYFWALRIPDHIKQKVHEPFNELKDIFAFKRWVHIEDYHITLAFLGAVEGPKLKAGIDLVQKGIKSETFFPLQVQGINTFGNQKSPRIFWAAVNHEERLHQLQAKVHQHCLEAGLELESRAYHPHITLARKWVGTEFQPDLLQEYNPFHIEPLSFMANEVVLYQTHLEKTPKYEPIATFSLVGE